MLNSNDQRAHLDPDVLRNIALESARVWMRLTSGRTRADAVSTPRSRPAPSASRLPADAKCVGEELSPTWTLDPIERDDGLTGVLYRTLQDPEGRGRAPPDRGHRHRMTRDNKPTPIESVGTNGVVVFRNHDDRPERVSREKLRRRINRTTEPKPGVNGR
jgi:hypothetical protein